MLLKDCVAGDEIVITCDIEVTDLAMFEAFLERRLDDFDEEDLEDDMPTAEMKQAALEAIACRGFGAMIETGRSVDDLGMVRLAIGNVAVVETDHPGCPMGLRFQVSAEIANPEDVLAAARDAYAETWQDMDWTPGSAEEALYEIALASNANPSPDECGFAFLDWAPRDPGPEMACEEDLSASSIEGP